MDGHCKFDELRMKTERELVRLIDHELDLGVREARQALSANNRATADGHYGRAKRAYAGVLRLIPLIDEQQHQLEERARHLREMLGGLSVPGSTPENIAHLAQALWMARGCPEGSPEDDWLRAEQALKTPRESHTVCC